MNPSAASQRIRSRRASGFSTVEAAVVLPVLLFLMLATAEFGRAFYQYNTLTKAVRNGARYMASHALSGSTGVIDTTTTDWTTNKTAARNLVIFGNPAGTGSPLVEGLAVGACNGQPAANDVTVTAVDTRHINITVVHCYQPLFSAGLPNFGFGTVGTPVTLTAALTMRGL